MFVACLCLAVWLWCARWYYPQHRQTDRQTVCDFLLLACVWLSGCPVVLLRGLKVSVYTGADWSVVGLPGNELVPRLCGHLFHQACLGEWFRRANGDTCPLCREGFIGTDVSLSRTGGATMEHRSAYTLINCQNPPMLSTTRSTNYAVLVAGPITSPRDHQSPRPQEIQVPSA
jgi:hypothetical protein